MIQSHKGKPGPTAAYGFLLSATLEEGVATPEQVQMKLAEALTWVEGVGEVEVECLGKLDIEPEEVSN